jgi:hypothetical protein
MLRLRTQSLRRYRLAGALPPPHGDDFYARLTDRAFQALTPAEDRTYGWVNADNLLLTDFHVGTVMRGAWATVCVRIDKRRVNARLLRAHLDLEMEALRKASLDAGGKGRIKREERKELRVEIERRLARETAPAIDLIPVLMHSKRRVAHVLSLSRGANEVVRLLFLDTFGVELVPLTPWRRSIELLEGPLQESLPLDDRASTSRVQLARLAELDRTEFSLRPDTGSASPATPERWRASTELPRDGLPGDGPRNRISAPVEEATTTEDYEA